MISFKPGMDALRRIIGIGARDIETLAIERWEIAPGETRFVEPARFLPGQLERIKGTAFGSMERIRQDFEGNFEAHHEQTLGFRLRDVDLVDGVLYAPGARRHLRRRERRRPVHVIPTEVISGAIYETWAGNRWFGNWLLNDCLTFSLAERHGTPVTSARPRSGHVADYERMLGMTPRRATRVHFDDLILFRDRGNNHDLQRRADDLRQRLTAQVEARPNPGVFLLRGDSGDRRALVNEQQIAERLSREHGFVVLDPLKLTVEDLVGQCALTRIVAGVEGSHLVHGLMVMPTDAALLVIQPPHRVVSVLKVTTDRQGQTFGFVVGTGGPVEFSLAWDDVARTLDLML